MRDDRVIFKRGDKPIITFYLLNDERPRFTAVHCPWCQKRISTINRNVIEINDSPLDVATAGSSTGCQCDRCQQRFRFVISTV